MFRIASLTLLSVSLLSLAGTLVADEATREFWDPECDSFPGSRVKYHKAKQWPLEPRLCAPSEPFCHRYHTAHYWPDPYRWQDRGSVRAHFAIQAAAGWTTNTTLYDQHFDQETQELNEAGRVHLKWILLYAPPQRRYPWVQTADTQQSNQARLASVQAEATALVGANCPAIALRICQPYGGSAQEVDLVRRSYLESIPVPRVSYTAQQGSSTGSSGGGGQSPQGGK
jgi:hypothetical protein